MKQIITLGLTLILMMSLVGFSKGSEINKESRSVKEFIDIECIASDISGRILVDKNTGVLYWEFGGKKMTPILNTDGTPKLYEGVLK